MNRRNFVKAIGLDTTAVSAFGDPERKLKIGHTSITWGTFPRGPEASATLEPAVKEIASLGYYSFETFPEVLEDWDAKGALGKLIDQYQLPLKSGYIGTILTEGAVFKEQ